MKIFKKYSAIGNNIIPARRYNLSIWILLFYCCTSANAQLLNTPISQQKDTLQQIGNIPIPPPIQIGVANNLYQFNCKM